MTWYSWPDTPEGVVREIEGSGGHWESEDCWCEPRVVQPCPECHSEPGCWKCGGEGVVPKFDDDEPCIVVHTGERRS